MSRGFVTLFFIFVLNFFSANCTCFGEYFYIVELSVTLCYWAISRRIIRQTDRQRITADGRCTGQWDSRMVQRSPRPRRLYRFTVVTARYWHLDTGSRCPMTSRNNEHRWRRNDLYRSFVDRLTDGRTDGRRSAVYVWPEQPTDSQYTSSESNDAVTVCAAYGIRSIFMSSCSAPSRQPPSGDLPVIWVDYHTLSK